MGAVKRRHTIPVSTARPTALAGIGWQAAYAMAQGFVPSRGGLQTSPTGLPVRNAQQVGMGNAQVACLMPDGTALVGGQNGGGEVPWLHGPDNPFGGQWEPYRWGLAGQRVLLKTAELEAEGFTAEEITAKYPGAHDKTRAQIEALEKSFSLVVAGQPVCHATVGFLHGGFTWEAIIDNIGVEPGPSSEGTVWRKTPVQVSQLESTPGAGDWFVPAHNLSMPTPAPLLSNLAAVVARGWRQLWLTHDGIVYSTGKTVRWSLGGSDTNKGFGPSPRPPKPPFTRLDPLNADMTVGSRVLANLNKVKVLHFAQVVGAESGCPYGKAIAPGNELFLQTPKGGTPVEGSPLPAKPTITEGATRELGEAGEETPDAKKAGLVGLKGTGGTLEFALPGSTVKPPHELVNGMKIKLLSLQGGAGLSNGEYFVVGVSGQTFKLSATSGGAAIVFTTDITGGIIWPQDKVAAPYAPLRSKVMSITMSSAAVASATARLLEVKRFADEQKFWSVVEGSNQSAAWRSRVLMPALAGGVVPVAVEAAGNGTYGVSYIVLSNGKVLVWGTNANGLLGNLNAKPGEEDIAAKPQYVKASGGGDLEGVTAVACGGEVTLFLKSDHTVWAIGGTERGALGKTALESKVAKVATPTQITGLPTTVGERPVGLAAGWQTCYALLENGKVMSWGNNEKGELGQGTVGGKYDKVSNPEPFTPTPALVVGVAGCNWVHAQRQNVSFVNGTTGQCWVCGWNEHGQCGNGEAGKSGGVAAVGTPHAVDLQGRKAISSSQGVYNTLIVHDGETLPRLVKPTLVPRGVVGGETQASILLEWQSGGHGPTENPQSGLTGSNGTINKTAHGYANGAAVALSGLVGGLGLPGAGTVVYVVKRKANSFQVAYSSGGTPINFTTALTAGTVASVVWTLGYVRQPTEEEEARTGARLAHLGEELQEAQEEENEERERQVQAEIELVEQEILEQEEKKTAVPVLPVEVTPGSGVLRLEFVPPGKLTRGSNYMFMLKALAHEGAGEWIEQKIPTVGLWDSPFGF